MQNLKSYWMFKKFIPLTSSSKKPSQPIKTFSYSFNFKEINDPNLK